MQSIPPTEIAFPINDFTFVYLCRHPVCSLYYSNNNSIDYRQVPIKLFPISKITINPYNVIETVPDGRIFRRFNIARETIFVHDKVFPRLNISRILAEKPITMLDDNITPIPNLNISDFNQKMWGIQNNLTNYYNGVQEDVAAENLLLLKLKLSHYCDENIIICALSGAGMGIFLLLFVVLVLYCCCRYQCCCRLVAGMLKHKRRSRSRRNTNSIELNEIKDLINKQKTASSSSPLKEDAEQLARKIAQIPIVVREVEDLGKRFHRNPPPILIHK